MNRLTAFAVVFSTLACASASAAVTQTVSVERTLSATSEDVRALLSSPDRWADTFREADDVGSKPRGGGRRAVRIHSDSVGHAHTLLFADDAEGTAFTFHDDDHDVSLRGRFTLQAQADGRTRVLLTVTVERQGLLTLVPDRLVDNRLGAFLDDILEDVDHGLQRPAALVAIR
jgi:hypothetical protein